MPYEVREPAKLSTKEGNPISTMLIPRLLNATAIKTTKRRIFNRFWNVGIGAFIVVSKIFPFILEIKKLI